MIKGQNSKNNLVAKESYYIDRQILSAFEDIDTSVTESYPINAFSDAQSKTYDRLNSILSKFKSLDRKYVPRKSIDGTDKVMLSKSGKDFVNIYKDGSFEILDDNGKVTARVKDIDDFSDNDLGVIFKKELGNLMHNNQDKNESSEENDENTAFEDNLLHEDILDPEQDDFESDESADESAACESSEEMSRFYLMIDEIQNDEDFDNTQELIESARVDGDITEEEYNQLQIELANRK